MGAERCNRLYPRIKVESFSPWYFTPRVFSIYDKSRLRSGNWLSLFQIFLFFDGELRYTGEKDYTGCVNMPVTAGRNDPCPCGSGKKYKKCCERVVAFKSAEFLREERERKLKTRLVSWLNKWFQENCMREIDEKWSVTFKKCLQLPVEHPIPSKLAYTYRFWMLFDATCFRGERPVEYWRRTLVGSSSQSERIAEELAGVHLCCYEVVRVNGEEVILRSLLTEDQEFSIRLVEPVRVGMLMFARLSRLVNRYELFGPYTSFGVEMKGEIDMYLKNQVQPSEGLQREYWHQHGLQVLGWMMQRAREMEQSEKAAEDLPDPVSEEGGGETTQEKEMSEMGALPVEKKWFNPPVLPEEEIGLPDIVEQQLNLFFSNYVEKFQEKTQSFYLHSLELFKKYVATYFGKRFTWPMLSGDVLSHFFGVWYVDTGEGGPIKSRIFLNTLKGLFRWIQEEAISDVYPAFAPVYRESIRNLPLSYEAYRWLRENGVAEAPGSKQLTGTVQMAVSGAEARLRIADQWLPLHMNGRGVPPTWLDHRFWVRGTVAFHGERCSFHSVESVYPHLQEIYEPELL